MEASSTTDEPADELELPVVIAPEPSNEPAIHVDGAAGGPGLELSHWPGNRTPAALRHELSTGSALAFAELDPAERRALAGDARRIANNHYDTDGICALFAVRHPGRARAVAPALLDAAAAGDFFRVRTPEALRADLVIGAATDPERSFLRDELAGLEDAERWQRATDHWMEHLDALLRGEVAPYAGLFEDELAAFEAELAELESAERTDDAARGLAVLVSPRAARAGRHALFTTARCDRVLALSPAGSGVEARLVVGTRSWFDTTRATEPPRPELEELVAELQRVSGAPAEDRAWRARPSTTPSPELWYGAAGPGLFDERNAALAPAPLPPDELLAAVRRAWPLRGGR